MALASYIIRRIYIPFYAIKLLAETCQVWGLRRWFYFWASRKNTEILEHGALRFSIRTNNLKTKMTDTFAVIESVHHNLYEREFYNTKFEIGEKDTVIDIGGYIGSFAVPAAKHARKGIVYSFEPSPSNFSQLNKNINLNNLKNVKTFNTAIAGNDRPIRLFLNNVNPASNNIYMKGKKFVEKKAISLETFFKQQKIEKCSFLKLDCEGAEYEILMSLKTEILKKIGKIACEFHIPEHYGISSKEFTPEKLVDFLKSHNFKVSAKRVNPYTGMLYASNIDF
jgi:FkbM family methyltransferase